MFSFIIIYCKNLIHKMKQEDDICSWNLNLVHTHILSLTNHLLINYPQNPEPYSIYWQIKYLIKMYMVTL